MSGADEMQAGRELDALVAEKVMGWKLESIIDDSGHFTGSVMWLEPRDGFAGLEWTGYVSEELPEFSAELRCMNGFGGMTVVTAPGIEWNPSGRMSHAWRVAERLGNKIVMRGPGATDMEWGAAGYDRWVAEFDGRGVAQADTVPLAICRAALKAVLE